MWTMKRFVRCLAVTIACWGPMAWADVNTDWDTIACDVVAATKPPTPVGVRMLAITQTAAYEAVKRATTSDKRAPEVSADAAVASAYRAALIALVPTQTAMIEAAYRKSLGTLVEGAATNAGVAIGERSAAEVVARKTDDGASTAESYRPVTSPGVYVPTAIPAVPQWIERKPWLMTRAAQFRPAPPPALSSAVWARDYNEVKAMGGKTSSARRAEQTDVARFWEATLPSIYHGVVRSVAEQPGRDIARNARLFAAVAQGMDDALVAVFDAKYHYNFWRPITAIRNGDTDGNDATERDASWTPFIDTPMHPEYPCAHCIVAATVGTILQADLGDAPVPSLTTTSYMVAGSKRSWTSVEDFIQEVAEARICDGVHYRTSTEVGVAMGREVGRLAAQRFFEGP
jgi:PAP2 superfamily.